VDRKLFEIAGKTALITGGSRGMGAMIAKACVDAGARVQTHVDVEVNLALKFDRQNLRVREAAASAM
jgi:NAD(P)-dependent dehydrogenase (short-subunit alcohol dehydrogenase family)